MLATKLWYCLINRKYRSNHWSQWQPFLVEEISNAGALSLNDPACNMASGHISQVGTQYRVETRLDECGTEVSYDDETKAITFKNSMMNPLDLTPRDST